MTKEAYAIAQSIIDGCWVVFAIVWILAAFTTKKTVVRGGYGLRALWFAILVIAFYVAIKMRTSYPLNLLFVPHAAGTAIAAIVVCLGGLAFTLRARFALGRNWSGNPTLKENHELIERGPYAYVRHPIYTGILTMAFGTILLSGRVSALVGWALLVIALWIKSAQEEQLLSTQFAAEYADYRRRVKRLIPFVW